MEAPNRYLDYLIDPDFQVVNRVFVSSFEKSADRTHTHNILSPNCRNKAL